MMLPNYENAFIPPAKLYDYLLSEAHSAGKGKAKFFREFGFDETNTDSLMRGLVAIVHSEEIIATAVTVHGVKYVIDGSLLTPVGDTVYVRTVWIIEIGEVAPRFVTAYPHSL